MVILYFSLPSRQAHFYAALVFLIASITDWIDGYLARRLKQISNFGKFLDPVADKLIVSVAMILLVYEYCVNPFPHQYVDIFYYKLIRVIICVCSITILCREMIVGSLREWMAEIGMSAKVAVSYLGKLKTTIQMIAITWLLWRPNRYSTIYGGYHFIEYIAVFAYFIAVILTLCSMAGYLKAGYKSITELDAKEDELEEKATNQQASEQNKEQDENSSNS